MLASGFVPLPAGSLDDDDAAEEPGDKGVNMEFNGLNRLK